jgi:hypothetical protein
MRKPNKTIQAGRFSLPAIYILLLVITANIGYPWSNGGYSTDFDAPKYGTHDWLAEHALDFLPEHYRIWIDKHFNAYLLGTEAPDNSKLNFMDYSSYGDTRKHHIYFLADASGIVSGEDDAALRAQEEYEKAKRALDSQDFQSAAYYSGSMSHYIADVAVFGHVMGKNSPWGNEKHHSDYEKYVQRRTDKYAYGVFEIYLMFDGELDATITAYRAAFQVGHITTFGNGKTMPCTWMDENYGWKNQIFIHSCGHSLNTAFNAITDVLYRLSTCAIAVTNKPRSLTTTWGKVKAVYQ